MLDYQVYLVFLHYQQHYHHYLKILGLNLLKTAVHEFVKANPNGVSNAATASILGLRSDYGGGSRDYLSYSILGLLMRDGVIERKIGSRDHVAINLNIKN
jgi:hypothetical protein